MRNIILSVLFVISTLVMCLLITSCDKVEESPISFDATLHFEITVPEEKVFSRFVLMTNASFGDGIINESSLSVKIDTLDYTHPSDHLVFDVALTPIDLREFSLFGKLVANDGTCYSLVLEPYNFLEGETYAYIKRIDAEECSGLPILFLVTPDFRIVESKTEWIENATATLIGLNADDISASCKIKGRGNASWTFPKKSFALKYSIKQSPFGFPSDKSWVLLADYTDRSLLRTAYMCETSMAAGLDYTINYKHINLYYNGKYEGVYVLTDKVERGKNRVNIKDDGFLIEDDHYYLQEPLYFDTDLLGYHYTFKYPDDDVIVKDDDNYIFIKDYINQVERCVLKLEDEPNDTEYLNYIDLVSFAKYFVASESLANKDPNRFYVLEARTSKIKCLPMWDAEYSLGLTQWVDRAENRMEVLSQLKVWENYFYFQYLIKSPLFIKAVKEEWVLLKNKKSDIIRAIDSIRQELSVAAKYNEERWPRTDFYNLFTNSFDTWAEEADWDKGFLEKRYEWMDNYINSL